MSWICALSVAVSPLYARPRVSLKSGKAAQDRGVETTSGWQGSFDAMAENLVDIICSDYHFPSLLACAIRMRENGMSMSDAVNMLTLNPARHLGLDQEIGSIELGKRADLTAFNSRSGFGDVLGVWVNGDQKFSTPAVAASQAETQKDVELLQEANQ